MPHPTPYMAFYPSHTLRTFASMENIKESEAFRQLIYEFYRLWIDTYGEKKHPPKALFDALTVMEERYHVNFDYDEWHWYSVDDPRKVGDN